MFNFISWSLAQITFLQFYNPDFLRSFGVGVINGSLWAIPVMLQFYLFYPLMALATKRKNFLWIVFLMIAGAIMIMLRKYMDANNDTFAKLIHVSLFPYLFLFLFGVIFRKLYEKYPSVFNGKALLWIGVYVLWVIMEGYFEIEGSVGNNLNIFMFCLYIRIQKLENVEYDREAVARRQIVFAIVRLNTIAPDPVLIGTALRIVEKITEPTEYINSLMAVYSMVRKDKSRCNELLHFMADAADRILSPYERATALLDIVPLALQNCDDDTPLNLLRKAEILTKKINIQYIADKIRNSITQLYSMLFHKYNDKKYLTHAISVIKSIDDVDVRLNHLTGLGQSENYEILPQYIKIKSLSEKMMQEGIHTNQIVILERLIRTVADRGREAIFFCDLAIFFRRNGEGKLSKRMMQSAIKEARIIRPLSRRAFVMCDIALKINAAGCEQMAQEVLDFAIDAATNIRQSSLRDEVFDELGLAIKLMQGM